ncbi:MAG: serine hydrolase [Polyangiaceae bacterium]
MRHASGAHRWIGTGYEPTGHVGHALYPVVDLRATAGEIATLLAAFANHGALNVRILRADTLARMLEPVAPALEPSQGLVFQRAELDGQTLWGHEGEDQGATTMAFFDPASGDEAVVLANGDAFASEDPARAEAMREILSGPRISDVLFRDSAAIEEPRATPQSPYAGELPGARRRSGGLPERIAPVATASARRAEEEHGGARSLGRRLHADSAADFPCPAT